MTKSVFISHSSIEESVAKKICKGLEERKLSCWFAPRDVGSGLYLKVLADAIRTSATFLIIVSKNSNDSRPVANEIAIAFKYKKPMFPVLISEVKPSDSLELPLEGWQRFDCRNGIDDEFLDSLAKEIRRQSGAPPMQSGPATPSEKLKIVGLRSVYRAIVLVVSLAALGAGIGAYVLPLIRMPALPSIASPPAVAWRTVRVRNPNERPILLLSASIKTVVEPKSERELQAVPGQEIGWSTDNDDSRGSYVVKVSPEHQVFLVPPLKSKKPVVPWKTVTVKNPNERPIVLLSAGSTKTVVGPSERELQAGPGQEIRWSTDNDDSRGSYVVKVSPERQVFLVPPLKSIEVEPPVAPRTVMVRNLNDRLIVLLSGSTKTVVEPKSERELQAVPGQEIRWSTDNDDSRGSYVVKDSPEHQVFLVPPLKSKEVPPESKELAPPPDPRIVIMERINQFQIPDAALAKTILAEVFNTNLSTARPEQVFQTLRTFVTTATNGQLTQVQRYLK